MITQIGIIYVLSCSKSDPRFINYRLQAFVDAVSSYVIESAPDLMSREFDREEVKLHATLMNSRFPVAMAKDAAAREAKEAESNWRKRDNERQWKIPSRQSFAATKIYKVCISSSSSSSCSYSTSHL